MKAKEHLESVWEMRKLINPNAKKPDALENEIKLNPLLSFIWGAFCELSSSRVSNGFSILPISVRDIYYYQQLYELRFNDFELRCIRAIDNIFLKHIAISREKKEVT